MEKQTKKIKVILERIFLRVRLLSHIIVFCGISGIELWNHKYIDLEFSAKKLVYLTTSQF